MMLCSHQFLCRCVLKLVINIRRIHKCAAARLCISVWDFVVYIKFLNVFNSKTGIVFFIVYLGVDVNPLYTVLVE